MDEEALKAELLKHIDPSPFLVDCARFNDRDLWEIAKRIARWADARARRECADRAERQRRVFLESEWSEGYNEACNDIEESILATIKEPAP